ncbi:hypothetical protein COHA_002942 [Chlorella ohadii]|uniref:Uncharacterized protein n=1 Tax=Chlorella ohadii TaxID=2649997 RepID=A0AAD5DWC1_9CHLO|nr:hypothetical protein COHA_002942 [Chlorella ohadii]
MRSKPSSGAGGRRASISGSRMSEEKVQRDVAPNIAALRAEGLDTASIERLFAQYPTLLTVSHATFSGSLTALRQLAALLPDDPRAVQAPSEATQLGVALWLYPTAGAQLLSRTNLGSLIDGNLRLRRRLGISDAQTALGLFTYYPALLTDFERAEAMVAHLQHLQADGTLSAEQVACLALTALRLTPAEFDRRWREGGLSRASKGALKSISLKDPASRRRAAAEALGELLQAADGVPGPLQQQYRQQGVALVERQPRLWDASIAALKAGWTSLQRLGLSSSQVVAVVQEQPAVLVYNWDGEAKQRLLAWVQQELDMTPFDLLTRSPRSVSRSVATLAMRVDFLRLHRPALWEQLASCDPVPLLRLLGETKRFCANAGCTATELDAFNCSWLATPAGRCWGAKPRQETRRTRNT